MTSIRLNIVDSLVSTIEASGEIVRQELTDDVALLETGLDSLGFAILVSRLEEELGFDPFSLADEPFYPVTLGEFISFYEQNQPS